MNTLLLLLLMATTRTATEYPCPQLSMKCHPAQLMPGDSLYVLLEANNPYEKPIFISDQFWPFDREVQINLSDTEGQVIPLLFESEDNVVDERIANLVPIQPGASRIIGALAINIPVLEDISEPFWEKHLQSLSPEGKAFLLKATLEFTPETAEYGYGGAFSATQSITLAQKILIKPRPANEMAKIQKWHKDTPKELFPKPEGNNPVRKIPSEDWIVPESKIIQVKGEKFSQWHFIRLGNRYPADPNAPETWQEWKKLEEWFTPSTMRDEICLTRILIQYCDTEDGKILAELKDWFTKMSEVQRTVMAKNIGELALGSRGTKLFESFKKIYAVVKEYDIAAKPEFIEKYFKETGL